MQILTNNRRRVVLMCGLFFVFSLLLSGGTKTLYIGDELGYIGAAQYMATGHAINMGASTFYMFGTGLFYAPIYWFTSDIYIVYHWVHVINALFYAGLFPLYIAIGQALFGIERKKATSLALVIMLYPFLTNLTLFSSAENCFTFFVTLLILMLYKLAVKPTVVLSLLSGLVAGFLYAIHHKGLLVALVFIATLFLLSFTRGKRTLWGITTVIPTLVIVSVVADKILHALYTHASFNASDRLLDNLLNISMWPYLLDMFSGQMIYVFLATLGIGYIGFIKMLRGGSFSTPHGITNIFIVFSFLACFGSSILSLVNELPRFEIFFYGRYFESFIPLFILYALLDVRASLKRWYYCVFMTIPFLLGTLYIAVRYPRLFETFYPLPFASPGYMYTAAPTLLGIWPSYLTTALAGIIGMLVIFFASRKTNRLALRLFSLFLFATTLCYPLFLYIPGANKMPDRGTTDIMYEEYYMLGQNYENVVAYVPVDYPNVYFINFQFLSNIRVERVEEEPYTISQKVTDIPLGGGYYWDSEIAEKGTE